MNMRFIGTEAELSAVGRLIKFGQKFELSAELARTSVLGSLPAIPEEVFQEIGFTEAELLEYGDPGPRSNPSPEFAAKWQAARLALHDYRESLKEAA